MALEAGNDLLLFANQQRYDAGVVERTLATVAGAIDSGRLDRARIEASWRRVRALLGGS
jgi:beta-N-acetylhexosaminidase